MDYIFTGVFTFEMVIKVRYVVALVAQCFLHPHSRLTQAGACSL